MDELKINTNAVHSGMVKDVSIEFLQEGQYPHAINTINHPNIGGVTKLAPEYSNLEAAKFTYTFNGSIKVDDNRFVIFSTNNTDSEIGLFDDRTSKYTILVNDSTQTKKLGFKLTHINVGVSKENWDCTTSIYWNNGLNPARCLNIDNVPYIKKYKKDPLGGCDLEENTNIVDIEKLRLSPLLNLPKVTCKKAISGGSLPNGSYRVAIAYAESLFKVTDYLIISEPIYINNNIVNNGALEVTVNVPDKLFSHYQLVLISTINQQTTNRLVGYYSVSQSKVLIDSISEKDTIIPLADLSLQSIYYEGGDEMFVARDYLIQTAPRTRPDFNYQPQANKIKAKWVAYSVPENYYRDNGELIGYTKDEVFIPFIRFVYNTGHRTSSFPLVNNEPVSGEKTKVMNSDSSSFGTTVEKWEIYETATITKTYQPTTDYVYPIMEGDFGYYESSEEYPNNKEVWGELSCNKLRLFKFPENCTVPNIRNGRLQILGFKLEGITYPLDENNNPVEGIVGYEILKADKEGNKTIITKGLIFNTLEYESQANYSNKAKTLIPNFPFNDLRENPYLSKKLVKGGCDGKGYEPFRTYNKQFYTFHSPETHFAHPSLPPILKVEAEYVGKALGYFEPCYKHPKHKLIRDFSLIVAGALGIGEGLMAIKGATTKTYKTPSAGNKGEAVTGGAAAQTAGGGVASAYQKAYDKIRKNIKNIPVIGLLGNTVLDVVELAGVLVGITPGGEGGGYTYSEADTAFKNVPSYVKIGTNVILFSYFFAQGTDTTLEVIKKLVPYRQHAYQCNMDGVFNNQICPRQEQIIRRIEDFTYIKNSYQEFQNLLVNNYSRENGLIIKLDKELNSPYIEDNSRQTIGTLRQWGDPSKKFSSDISAFYVSLKRQDRNIYGKLHNVNILPTNSKVYPISFLDKVNSEDIFGGDTIIEEFTLKRRTQLFSQTQADDTIGVPDGYEFDYKQYPNVLYPRYWMDTTKYDLSKLFNLAKIKLPNDSFYLDRDPNECRGKIGFSVNEGYMYTSVNGVVRFFVESSFYLPYRKLSDKPEEQHYDKRLQTNLSKLFRQDYAYRQELFEIDRTYNILKQLNFSYSFLQREDFSVKNNACFTYEPSKILYSLPANKESMIDNWRTFLVNNYYKFSSSDGKVTSIKNFDSQGVLYFFSKAPLKIHSGVDELQLEGNVKLTIGDGGLFARSPQSLVETDVDYSECQQHSSIVATPYGLFFVSQRQAKIFKVQKGEGVLDISSPIKNHLNKYLPCLLQKYYSEFNLTNNPVIGTGIVTSYDNINEIIYFSKIDYRPKKEYEKSLTYYKDNIFLLNKYTKVYLQDPAFFESASWTLSYDPKGNQGRGAYVSFHNWMPEGVLGGGVNFYTVKNSRIWKHSQDSKSFCSFYGTQYPWVIDVPQANPLLTTTFESVEYYLECYSENYNGDFHVLLDNFDKAIVYNTEQISGMLNLNMRNSQKPHLILEYPKYNNSSVDIEVVKKEQKYRFNQFRDLTKNRGEFSTIQNTLFIVGPDGVTQNINNDAINYNKQQTQRKKFRHIKNVVRFIKTKPENKMLFSLMNSKQIISFR